MGIPRKVSAKSADVKVAPKMNANALRILSSRGRECVRPSVRRLTTQEEINSRPIYPAFIKIKEMQKKFQIDDGVPVHLKNGARDHAQYYLSILGTITGFVWAMSMYWKLINK